MTLRAMNADLFPYCDGVPNLSAHGEYALLYKHPDDLHLTPIFNGVSLALIWEYVTTRTWCREAMASGSRFTCLPSSEVSSKGAVQ